MKREDKQNEKRKSNNFAKRGEKMMGEKINREIRREKNKDIIIHNHIITLLKTLVTMIMMCPWLLGKTVAHEKRREKSIRKR